MRASGVRRSWATLSVTCFTSAINASMRSSIRLRFSASWSHSSRIPRSGIRLPRPVCMMARLVALIDSIRPTVRRVTEMLATPARTKIKPMAHAKAILILSPSSRRSLMSLPTSKCDPSGSVSNIARNRGRLAESGLRSCAVKVSHPPEPVRADGHASRLPAIGANEESASR